MVRVTLEFQPFPVMVDKASVAVQKIVGVPTDAVFLCQCLGTEIAIRLALVQCAVYLCFWRKDKENRRVGERKGNKKLQ